MNIDGENEDQELLLEDTHQEGEGEANQAPEDQDDELHLSIEGEDDGNETELVRRLRDQLRTAHGEIATYKRQPVSRPTEIGPKPTLSDFDFDEEKWEAAYDKWKDNKRAVETQGDEQRKAQEAQEAEFSRLRSRHQQRAAVLKIKNFDECEKAVVEALGPEMAGVMLKISSDSAKLVGALGQNPTALAKIQAEPDPLLKIKMMVQMERNVKTRTPPPPPESDTIQRSTASLAPKNPDKELEKLEKEADRTGDRTKVIAWKRAQKAKEKTK